MSIFQWLVYRGHKTSSYFALNSTKCWCDILCATKIRNNSKIHAITFSFYNCFWIFGCRSMSLWISLIGRVSQVCSMAFCHMNLVRRLFEFFSRLLTSSWVSSKDLQSVSSWPTWGFHTGGCASPWKPTLAVLSALTIIWLGQRLSTTSLVLREISRFSIFMAFYLHCLQF